MEFLSTTNLDWVRPHLPVTEAEKAEAQLSLVDMSSAGGLNAAMKVLNVSIPSNPLYPRRFIIKRTAENGFETSKLMGCPREAFFYKLFADKVKATGAPIPDVLFAYGDMITGDKVLLIEDVSYYGVQSGYFFGPGTPLNWGHDLAAKTARAPNGANLTAGDIAMDTFAQVAKIHRLYWGDSSLREHKFLRGQDWVHGEGRDAWDGAQNKGKDCWTTTKAKIAEGKSCVKWDENLISCMDACFANVSWEKYQEDLKTRPWTLVHGDLHPANIMWVWADEQYPVSAANGKGRSLLLDWEMVGLGSGPQDIAQYLISHMNPETRRAQEEGLVHCYYQILVEETSKEDMGKPVGNYSFEDCWRDYVYGGAERWLWFVAYLAVLCPDPMTQYFQDQTAAFLRDHNLTAANIGMPRV